MSKQSPTPEEYFGLAIKVLLQSLSPLIAEEVKRALANDKAVGAADADGAMRFPLDWVPGDGDFLMTAKEASTLLRTPEGTIGAWRSAGTGPRWFRVGGSRVVYKRSEIANWLTAQEAAPLWK